MEKKHHFLVSIYIYTYMFDFFWGKRGTLKMEALNLRPAILLMVRKFRSSPFTALEVSVSRRR